MYTLLSVPKDVQIFFPMGLCLGRCLVLGCWRSAANWWDAGFWFYPYAGGAVGDENRHPLVLLTMAIGEWVAPQGEQRRVTTVPRRCTAARYSPLSKLMGERWQQLRLH